MHTYVITWASNKGSGALQTFHVSARNSVEARGIAWQKLGCGKKDNYILDVTAL